MTEASGRTDTKGAAFTAYLAEKRPLIDDYLTSHLPSAGEGEPARADLARYLYDPLARFTRSGGKRTRPALVLLGCEAVGGDASRALAPATAIEDFQSAALIHDDIADEGEMRRGQPCVHRTEGVGVAINVGDLALVEVIEKVLATSAFDGERRLRVLRALVSMERRTLEGQALDLGWARDERWDITVASYLTMASHKTAFYSAATPLAVGAIVGGGNDAQVEGLRAFGMSTGLAFQLQDDLLNLVGDESKQGKDFRSDITEGKRTMMVCWALEHLDVAKRDELISILSSHATDRQRLARAVELMETAGAIDAVRDYAHKTAEDAKRELADVNLAQSTRDVLESMADFFVERAG
ncbi:MAG: polyprenyl synthetase family protein [Tractidigestivibacter sp.]|jgi:geranylgeranyl diphosphate synthase type I|uniref:polyprenyl synthetase family protein n=1 Tax=Tractidigestivibacter sp. TaxID=2847320 RepID=UPI003D941C55